PYTEESGRVGPDGVARPRFHALYRRRRTDAVAARKRHRRADSFRSGVAHHPVADQPSAQDRGSGGLWHRDRGAGAGPDWPVKAAAKSTSWPVPPAVSARREFPTIRK